jgi:hypothetical protein
MGGFQDAITLRGEMDGLERREVEVARAEEQRELRGFGEKPTNSNYRYSRIEGIPTRSLHEHNPSDSSTNKYSSA